MSPDHQPGSRSALLLARLHTLPRLTVPVVVLVLLLVGMFAPAPFAVPALALLAVFVAWLATLSWPVLDRAGRLLRILAVGALVGLLVSRALGLLE